MLVVKIELHNANTGRVSEVGRLIIANDETSDSEQVGNYRVCLARDGVTDNRAVWGRPAREGRVLDYPRLDEPVFELVARALAAIGFGKHGKA